MMPYEWLPEEAQAFARLLPATHTMNAFNGLAMDKAAVFDPTGSLIILLAQGLLGFGLALYLFSWDSQNNARRGQVWLGQVMVGALSSTARAAGWKDDRRLIPALESEVHVGGNLFDRLSGAARFDFGVVPNGYAWVFPKRDHLSIGVLSTRRGAVRLPTHLERYYERLGIHSIEREERHGSLIPFSARKAGLAYCTKLMGKSTVSKSKRRSASR